MLLLRAHRLCSFREPNTNHQPTSLVRAWFHISPSIVGAQIYMSSPPTFSMSPGFELRVTPKNTSSSLILQLTVHCLYVQSPADLSHFRRDSKREPYSRDPSWWKHTGAFYSLSTPSPLHLTGRGSHEPLTSTLLV